MGNLHSVRKKLMQEIVGAGAEKVVINSSAAQEPDFIYRASETFGSSTIVVCMDVKKKKFGKLCTWIRNGKESTAYSPIEFAKLMEEKGAGELIVQSIEKDGMMNGYDIDLVKSVSEAVTIPVVALGGAGNLNHLRQAFTDGHANGLAAGSMFVYQGPMRGVLINYPEKAEIKSLLD